MNPYSWNAPWFIVACGLFVIVMLRANGTYWLGRGISAGTSRTKYASLLDSAGYHRAQSWLDRWGAPVVSACFLMVGVQTLVLLAAGVGRMSMRRFMPAVVLGCILWALLYSTIGFVGISAVMALYAYSPVLTWLLGALAVAGLTAYILVRVRQRRREKLA
ncbi:DedA family protein [Propionibacteriaceae bacterium Y1923]|uniref:DedA family protein n=1 Tax=Aestuariimicrobium sp. Y1814 TaxID=3418742 RepID=UPI003C15C3A1